MNIYHGIGGIKSVNLFTYLQRLFPSTNIQRKNIKKKKKANEYPFLEFFIYVNPMVPYPFYDLRHFS